MNSNKPVVVHVIHHLGIGGMEQVLMDTVNSLSGEFVHVIISLTDAGDEHKASLTDDVKVIELQKRYGNDLSLWPRIYRILREHGANVFHTYNIGTIEYQLAAFVARVPLRVHAEHGRDASDPDGTKRKYLLLRKFVRFFVHRWIAVSEDLETWLGQTVGVGRSKIVLARNGVDTRLFTPLASQMAGTSQDYPDGFKLGGNLVVGTVGRLDEVKNQHLLLEAVALANRATETHTPRFRLAIIGDGPMLESLQIQARELSLDGMVWFAGARHDVHRLVPLLDVFVMTSDAEGIPIALLEAMACGVPVIVTRVGGMPEVVDNETGILFPPGDAMALKNALLAMVNQPELATERAEHARARVVAEFSRERMVDFYRQIYRGEYQR